VGIANSNKYNTHSWQFMLKDSIFYVWNLEQPCLSPPGFALI